MPTSATKPSYLPRVRDSSQPHLELGHKERNERTFGVFKVEEFEGSRLFERSLEIPEFAVDLHRVWKMSVRSSRGKFGSRTNVPLRSQSSLRDSC